jgi:hypothetical protein
MNTGRQGMSRQSTVDSRPIYIEMNRSRSENITPANARRKPWPYSKKVTYLSTSYLPRWGLARVLRAVLMSSDLDRLVIMAAILGIFSRAATIAGCSIALLWCANGFSDASAADGVSGKAVFLVTPSNKIPLGAPADDQMIIQSAERGTQLEFDGNQLFENSSLLRTSICDLTRGRGTCFGYHIFESSDGDQLLAKFSGMVLPDSNVDKKPPAQVMRGTWVYVKGTGKFTDIKGGGSYRGHYISSTEYVLEWSGELTRSAQGSAANFDKEGR